LKKFDCIDLEAREDATYRSWRAMKERCYNSNNKEFHRYGKKGISVDPAWEDSFEQFFTDMGERPKGKTLDRIDGTKGYEPGNCRWATYREQKLNQYVTKYYEFEGKRMVLGDWAKETGIPEQALYMRLNRSKWTLEDALTIPIGGMPTKSGYSQIQSRKLTLNGESLSLKQWAVKTGIPLSTLKQRTRKGWDDERVLTQPIDKRKSKTLML
jgi:hypothetical protein